MQVKQKAWQRMPGTSRTFVATALLLSAFAMDGTAHAQTLYVSTDEQPGNDGLHKTRQGTGKGPPPSLADALAEVACLPLDFPLDTAWSYSDTGYFLLGLLIERASGQTHEAFLRERVFAPLGMDHTRLLSQADLISNRADGYVWAGGAYRNGPALSSVVEFSFGGFVSTVGDLARYDAALVSGRLLRPETVAAMWTPTPVGEAHYGPGFSLRPLGGRRLTWPP